MTVPIPPKLVVEPSEDGVVELVTRFRVVDGGLEVAAIDGHDLDNEEPPPSNFLAGVESEFSNANKNGS